jgi:NAD(P)H-dependent FMN reductase
MQQDALRVAIILGTAQEGRSGSAVANWFTDQARLFDQFTIDVINLAEVELPLVPPRSSDCSR